jgi:hypothetical protein
VENVVTGMGNTIPLGSVNLTAAQAYNVLNTVPGQASNVTFTSNLLLNLAQQVITAELNAARGSGPSSSVQSAIASANSAITVALVGNQIRLSTGLSTDAASALETTIENFNASSDCH